MKQSDTGEKGLIPIGTRMKDDQPSDKMRATMKCGHCGRAVWILHVGAGPGLCCECVHVHRLWQALGGNEYCDGDSLAAHASGKWCEEPPWLLFARLYADRSGVTVEWLREHGREARPCDCGDIDCMGWQMVHTNDSGLNNTLNKEEQAWQAKERAGLQLGQIGSAVPSTGKAR